MVYAIVPVKTLQLAKGRLSSILTASERRALVLAMLGDVLAARGAAATLVLHADIPLVTPGEIERMVVSRSGARGAVIAPARDSGTNALLTWPPLALPYLAEAGSETAAQRLARELSLCERVMCV